MLTAADRRERIRALVYEEIGTIMAEEGLAAVAITDDGHLSNDLGLSSMHLAQLVSVLEEHLDADPFESLVPMTSVRTVGDVIAAYDRFLAGERADAGAEADLEETRRRAQARRRRV